MDGAGLGVPSAGWWAKAADASEVFSPVTIRDKYDRPFEASMKPTP